MRIRRQGPARCSTELLLFFLTSGKVPQFSSGQPLKSKPVLQEQGQTPHLKKRSGHVTEGWPLRTALPWLQRWGAMG